MEKKNLAKGLKDISRAFITADDESGPDDPSLVFLTNPVRQERCSACINVIEERPGPLKCRIFSSKNKEYGVMFLQSIMPGYARYCRYITPLTAQESEDKKEPEKPDTNKRQYNVTVEEIITSQKNIFLDNDPDPQDAFKNLLSQYLEEGYEIVKIDLEKKEEHKDPAGCITRHEKVSILRNGPKTLPTE
ncbi:MAG: hypothetical protein GX846_01425 [Deltaproteobacteria bacterium]|nr:hypothetical protein [Deltaproteobacteria bacterium]